MRAFSGILWRHSPAIRQLENVLCGPRPDALSGAQDQSLFQDRDMMRTESHLPGKAVPADGPDGQTSG